MGFLSKLRENLLGVNYDDDDEYVDEYVEEYIEEEEPPRRKRPREYNYGKEKETVNIPHSSSRKASSHDSKVVSLPGSNHNIDVKMKIVICRPRVVDDSTSICDHLKNNIICVVNLEGVDRVNAQRIADFLGGACYALSGEIQRISNEIFLIAPFNIGISSELKEELKSNGLVLPWISSAFK